jgi:hypothetical protein
MGVVRRIIFYGNSVILGALEYSFRRISQVQVIGLLPPFPGKSGLEELDPDVIFFDMDASNTEGLFSLLETCPKILLVGVSSGVNLVRIWSGRQLKEPSTKSLLEVIEEQMKELPVTSGNSLA